MDNRPVKKKWIVVQEDISVKGKVYRQTAYNGFLTSDTCTGLKPNTIAHIERLAQVS